MTEVDTLKVLAARTFDSRFIPSLRILAERAYTTGLRQGTISGQYPFHCALALEFIDNFEPKFIIREASGGLPLHEGNRNAAITDREYEAVFRDFNMKVQKNHQDKEKENAIYYTEEGNITSDERDKPRMSEFIDVPLDNEEDMKVEQKKTTKNKKSFKRIVKDAFRGCFPFLFRRSRGQRESAQAY